MKGECLARRVSLLVALALLLLTDVTHAAQSAVQAPDSATQELILRDGTHAVGHVEEAPAGLLRFRTLSGALVEVEEGQVLSLRPLATARATGPVWPEDPNGTRLFFTPTGRSLRPGQGSFGVYELFLPNLQVGLAKQFSIGGGTPLIFDSGGPQIFWLTPKIQLLDRGNVQLAIGTMHFFAVKDNDVGLGFAVLTMGPRDKAVTLGWGVPYAGKAGAGMAMLGGEFRTSPRVKFITENYLMKEGGLLSGGLRWMGDRLSADLALGVPLDASDFFVFPLMNFVYTFGRQEP